MPRAAGRTTPAFMLLLCLTAVVVGCGEAYKLEKQATSRVERMFTYLTQNTTANEDWAMCLFSQGTTSCPIDGNLSVSFDQWRKAKDIYKITSWEIKNATADLTSDPPLTRVECLINGKSLVILARDRWKLTWE